MAKQPKVSVVVPIYKVEKYLRECVDSIINQILTDIEIILVDDGSPDNCGKIIDEYAKQDSRIIAIHQKNQGYSAAVNKGIDLAKGEYIGIIESDDWIEPDMYEKLYQYAKSEDADIAKGMFYFFNPTLPLGHQDVIYANPKGIDLRWAPNRAFSVSEWPTIIGFHASIWSSIYKADFIKKIKIPETAGASYQDFPFMIEAMCKAKRIVIVKQPFVHWRNEPGQGNSTSANGKKLLLMAKNTKTGLDILKDSHLYNRAKEEFFFHAFLANAVFYQKIDKAYKKEYGDILAEIFGEIKDDANFRWKYFNEDEKAFVEAIIGTKTWSNYRRKHRRLSAKYKLQNTLARVFPTYRTIDWLKGLTIELNERNKLLVQDLQELKQENTKSQHKS